MKFDLTHVAYVKRKLEVGYAKRKMGICKMETDKVTAVGWNVPSSCLRDITSDSGAESCVQPQYGHRNELITGKYIMHVHIGMFIPVIKW